MVALLPVQYGLDERLQSMRVSQFQPHSCVLNQLGCERCHNDSVIVAPDDQRHTGHGRLLHQRSAADSDLRETMHGDVTQQVSG